MMAALSNTPRLKINRLVLRARILNDNLGWTTEVSYSNPGTARSIALAKRMGCTRGRDAAEPPRSGAFVYRRPAPSEIAI